MQFSRRTLLAGGAALLARRPASAKEKLKVAIFSKHLQFLQGEELAKGAAEIGFDGIDITVRKGGHVEPERVRQDLPPLVATIRQQGLEVPMVTTDIADAETPFAEDIVKTTAELGIRHYRFGAFKYALDQPYPSATGRNEAAAGQTGRAQPAVPGVRHVPHAFGRRLGGRVDLGPLDPERTSTRRRGR